MKVVVVILLYVVVSSAENPTVLLQNAAVPGTRMPVIGLGTGGYGTQGNVNGEYWNQLSAQNAVVTWLGLDGVRIDNANNYNTSDGVAAGIALSGRNRSSLFITSKTGPSKPLGYDTTLEQVNEILESLKTTYVDLLLLHWPGPQSTSGIDWPCYTNQTFKKCRQESWRALEEVFKSKKALAIGVSNFEKNHLEDIFEMMSLLPSVNQVEFHPYYHEDDLLEFCKENNILFNGYSSVGCPDHMSAPANPNAWKTQVMDQPLIQQIAKKYNKSPAQVILNWSWQQGLVVNARSWDPAHHIENLNFFDFMLTSDEISQIGAIPKPSNPKVCPYPSVIP